MIVFITIVCYALPFTEASIDVMICGCSFGDEIIVKKDDFHFSRNATPANSMLLNIDFMVYSLK